MSWSVLIGGVLDLLPALNAGSFDAVLCDPPYGLSFMGKEWDHGVPGEPVWREALRVLKPGAHLLAFGGTRTFHRMACAVEDAGFEIRDSLCWLYGSGFPKSKSLREVGPAWKGYGTALKPAWEPCIVAMKPLDGTFAQNALEYGVAGLNVDGGRIGTAADKTPAPTRRASSLPAFTSTRHLGGDDSLGRFPANVLLDEESAALLDEQSGERTHSWRKAQPDRAFPDSIFPQPQKDRGERGYPDSGGASRFFYCAKASRSEREAGLDGAITRKPTAESAHSTICRKCNRQRVNVKGSACECEEPEWTRETQRPVANHHPTVKPIKLCEYLARLILPPERDTPRRLLVPFSGSGSEMIGALLAGWDEVVGIEMEPEYVRIAEARLAHWANEREKSIDDSQPMIPGLEGAA